MRCSFCKQEIQDSEPVITKVDFSFGYTSQSKNEIDGMIGQARLGAINWEEPLCFCCISCMIEYAKIEASKALHEYTYKLKSDK